MFSLSKILILLKRSHLKLSVNSYNWDHCRVTSNKLLIMGFSIYSWSVYSKFHIVIRLSKVVLWFLWNSDCLPLNRFLNVFYFQMGMYDTGEELYAIMLVYTCALVIWYLHFWFHVQFVYKNFFYLSGMWMTSFRL